VKLTIKPMLSEDKLNNIHKLELEEILQIFHECKIALGLEDMENASKALGVSKRRLYQLMDYNNSIQIGCHKLPLVNLINKN
jgi:hypothetical protein